MTQPTTPTPKKIRGIGPLLIAAAAIGAGVYGEVGPSVLIALCVIAALALFLSKVRGLIWYAAAEIAVGLWLLIDAIDRLPGHFSHDFSDDFAKLDARLIFLQTITSIYVLVRGLDNLHKGIGDYRCRRLAVRARRAIRRISRKN